MFANTAHPSQSTSMMFLFGPKLVSMSLFATVLPFVGWSDVTRCPEVFEFWHQADEKLCTQNNKLFEDWEWRTASPEKLNNFD
jgi:hypothetical protein